MISYKQISLTQLFCLVVLTQIGVHVLTVPYAESSHAGHDAWMSVLIGGAFAQTAILVIYLLARRYPNRSLPEYIGSIIGRPAGAVANLAIAAYCIQSSVTVIISYTDLINRWVLYSTPWFVIIGLIVIIAAYVASSPLRPLTAVTQTVMYMFAIGFVIVCISGAVDGGGLSQGGFRHFFPLGEHGIAAIVRDSIPALWAYAGYELLLYVFPLVKCKKKREILVTMSAANGFTAVFYLLISYVVIYNFSEHQLRDIPEPLVFILRQFNWPVVQSLDTLFMILWLSVCMVTAYVYLFLSARFIAFVGRKEIRNHTLLIAVLAAVCFMLGAWNPDRQWISRFNDFTNIATAVFAVGIPAVLLGVSLIRRKGRTT